MRCCGNGLYGLRAPGLVVVLWRAGLRIQEALDLTELDLRQRRARPADLAPDRWGLRGPRGQLLNVEKR